MASAELGFFLMNMKLIYHHGISHSKNNSKLNRLLALHNSHYVVEQVLRERAKDMPFSGALNESSFADILKRVHLKQPIPDCNRLQELNNDRNDAEHYFNVPDSETMNLYIRVVGDFLRWSYKNYFGCDYDSLRFEDFINDKEIREHMIKASELIDAKEFKNACEQMNTALAIFKSKLFAFFVDPKLWNIPLGGFSLPTILSELTLKIIFSNDIYTLNKLIRLPTTYIEKDGQIQLVWNVAFIGFETKEETKKEYDDILNIILTYQDRFSL